MGCTKPTPPPKCLFRIILNSKIGVDSRFCKATKTNVSFVLSFKHHLFTIT